MDELWYGPCKVHPVPLCARPVASRHASTIMTKASFKQLLEEILMVPPGGLSESDTRETVENWSSLADVEIMTVLSSELGVDAESIEYESVGELLALLEERQVFTAA